MPLLKLTSEVSVSFLFHFIKKLPITEISLLLLLENKKKTNMHCNLSFENMIILLVISVRMVYRAHRKEKKNNNVRVNNHLRPTFIYVSVAGGSMFSLCLSIYPILVNAIS